jgi:hypothetical protein
MNLLIIINVVSVVIGEVLIKLFHVAYIREKCDYSGAMYQPFIDFFLFQEGLE